MSEDLTARRMASAIDCKRDKDNGKKDRRFQQTRGGLMRNRWRLSSIISFRMKQVRL